MTDGSAEAMGPSLKKEAPPTPPAQIKKTAATTTSPGESSGETPPPLPPRPKITPSRQASATTELQAIDVHTVQLPGSCRGLSQISQSVSGGTSAKQPWSDSELGAAACEATSGPASPWRGDDPRPIARQLSPVGSMYARPFDRHVAPSNDPLEGYEHEFEAIDDSTSKQEEDGSAGEEDEQRLAIWKAKLKHYLILSSSGKPIYSRHGDVAVVNSFMGVIQTIISFYEGASTPLQAFSAGGTRFVVLAEGPLYFVAISRLGESDTQLRSQLEALYMQILSTLTLPRLTSIFAHRPNTDLRKPLEGTEPLLSSLADNFTRGSPSMLLNALECLRLRETHREAITSAFLKSHAGGNLLYGMIVAGGRLVSVIRPRQHSLHPSDLQLIFNMLFASGGFRTSDGEYWIPLCLPAFNNRGFLYMYVSFFDASTDAAAAAALVNSTALDSSPPQAVPFSPKRGTAAGAGTPPSESIAIILISPDPASFYDLQTTRNNLVASLTKNQLFPHIRASIRAGRPSLLNDVSPGSPLAHFLYRSRANVQFCMPSLAPYFDDDDDDMDAKNTHDNRSEESPSNNNNTAGACVDSKETSAPMAEKFMDKAGGSPSNSIRSRRRRQLMTLYHSIHAAAHTRHTHLKTLYCVADDSTALVWITSSFELYCVAGPNTSRSAMTQAANRVAQWAKREEERLFIIGGGVF